MASADDLFSGGFPAVKFKTLGDRKKMTIKRVGEPTHERDLSTGEVKKFPSGDPRPMLVCDVQIDERDPEIAADDGMRTLYLQGKMLQAAVQAVRAKRLPGLRNGGVLDLQWYDETPATKKGFNPTKEWRARYEPPTGVAADEMFDDLPAKKAPVDSGPDW